MINETQTCIAKGRNVFQSLIDLIFSVQSGPGHTVASGSLSYYFPIRIETKSHCKNPEVCLYIAYEEVWPSFWGDNLVRNKGGRG